METIRKWLKGRKTYIVAVGAILAVVVGWADGGMELPAATEKIVAAIIAMTVRAGIAKGELPSTL